jgi:hypothetical protein
MPPTTLAALAALALPRAHAAPAWPAPARTASGWASAGNHRFKIDVSAPAGGLVAAAVPWRRRDAFVSTADTFIVAGAAGAAAPLVRACFRNDSSLSSAAATFFFTADAGVNASYYLYYLPFSTCEYAGGACEYNADVAYAPRAHCADAPWWPAGAAALAPDAVTYEAVSDFDAFTDMERLASRDEVAAFFAAAAPPPPLRALLIAESAALSARVWGSGGSAAGAPSTAPFCVYAAAAGGTYLKTGGDPNITSGWDHGDADKCCSTDPASCVWFGSAEECAAFDARACRACRAGDDDVGCPSWASGGGAVPLPAKYLAAAPAGLASLAATLAPNQNFSFQALVVAPPDARLTVDSVTFAGDAAAGLTFSSFSTSGVDWWGRAFAPTAVVDGLLPLWLGVAVDRAAAPGAYNVTATVALTGAAGSNALPLSLALTVAGAPLADGADAPPHVHWLNSRLGADDDSVPRPFSPLRANASALPAAFSMQGKEVVIGASGLPASITTFGTSASPPVDARGPTTVLDAAGVTAAVALSGGPNLTFSSWATLAFSGNGSACAWTAASPSDGGAVTLTVSGSIDFSGFISLDVSVQPARGTPANATLAFSLVVPAALPNALYGMGLGARGGYFAKLFPSADAPTREWAWDGVNGNNGAWLGSTTGGVYVKAKGDDPLWQASVPFDDKSSPPPPPAWLNGGKGGMRVARDGRVSAFSGAFAVGAGGPVSFKASLLVTPVKNLNLTKHWALRYAQLDGPANYSFLASQGATVINIHQGNIVNPWINYPYLTNELMNATAAEVHGLGMRFSIYNTMRELSNRCAETFAMRAMGEAYVPGGGAPAGADWLKEHVGSDFLAAWSTPIAGAGNGFVTDAAMRVGALSRWNNYYVEGIQQMMRDFTLDGVYLDEVAYDRTTMMRMRKLLDAREGVIDHHSDSGAFCVSPAAIYNEHYAFIDKLWYGEGFDYDAASPDYWLVEMSGLVFGLTADMLRYSGMTPKHFTGLLFAETNRWQSGLDPESATTDPFVPVALWRLLADASIADAAMFGWWLADALGPAALPVAAAAGGDSLKVTTFALPAARARAIVVIASFASASLRTSLLFNNAVLGLPGNLTAYCLHIPALPPFQAAAPASALGAAFDVPAGQGVVFDVRAC